MRLSYLGREMQYRFNRFIPAQSMDQVVLADGSTVAGGVGFTGYGSFANVSYLVRASGLDTLPAMIDQVVRYSGRVVILAECSAYNVTVK